MQYLSPYCGAAVLLFFRGSFFRLGLSGGFCFRVCRGFFGRFGFPLFFRLCRSFGFNRCIFCRLRCFGRFRRRFFQFLDFRGVQIQVL